MGVHAREPPLEAYVHNTKHMLVKLFAERALAMAEGLRLVDYCLCLKAAYVVVEGPRGRALGFAHIPHEDLHDLGDTKPPRLEEMPEFVVDLNPLNRVLGVAMLNAVSQYHLAEPVSASIYEYIGEEPVCLIGNMGPLAEQLRMQGRRVYVFERSRELRRHAFSDVEEEILLPACKTLVITGMTLLNFTLDKILENSNGLNILTGPTAGLHPEIVKGTRIHVLASMKFNVEAAVQHLRLGNYVSLALHPQLGRPYAIDLRV
ncbi:MAG: Rossmann-like domain-containing protein [Infirmifilum uzonense]|uniref:Rossmann-like domain-containing protein n=1 Tax=Infirmifilum uzonense TaxID=1550241 RepID=UPI003C72AF56